MSADKAYVFDQPGERIVVWNPSSMTLTGKTIDLSMVARDGYLVRLSLEQFGPQRRGPQLLIPTAWVGQDDEYRHAMGLTVVDTPRDEVVHVAEDERCGEAYMSLRRDDGDIYFFPGSSSASAHFFADARGPSCALRVRADALDFDADYRLDLSAAGNGSAAASAVPDGASGFYFGAADPQAFRPGRLLPVPGRRRGGGGDAGLHGSEQAAVAEPRLLGAGPHLPRGGEPRWRSCSERRRRSDRTIACSTWASASRSRICTGSRSSRSRTSPASTSRRCRWSARAGAWRSAS